MIVIAPGILLSGAIFFLKIFHLKFFYSKYFLYICTMKNLNYEGYTIIDDGKIYNKFGREIGSKNSKGYTYVTINGKQWLRHKLVWFIFIGKIPEGYEIDHIVPVKNGGTDALSNLRLVTHKENCNNYLSKCNYQKANSSYRKYKTEEERKYARKEYFKKWEQEHSEYRKEYFRLRYQQNKKGKKIVEI